MSLISIPYPLLEEKMNHLFSLKSRPKRASFRSESEVARALRPRNFLAEEKRSLLLLLDWDVEYSAVSVGAAGGTAAAAATAAVVTVADFAIIIEYRVSREPCNNILQPTCTFDFLRVFWIFVFLVIIPKKVSII